MNGTSLIVPVTKVELSPVNQEISFSYSARLSDGNELPNDLISFDSQTIQFEVSSTNQALAGDYFVTVEAASDHDDLLNTLPIKASFSIRATRKYANRPPVFTTFE